MKNRTPLSDAPDLDLERQARFCELMGSPFVATFLRAARDDYLGGSRLRDLLQSRAALHRPGLRLSGAFHYLALAGEPTLEKHYPSVGGDGDPVQAWYAASAILDRDPELVERLFIENVQTNESSRSMPILGGYLLLAATFRLPFRVFEIGASAGFVSRFDRYQYVGNDWEWGDARSPLVLQNRTLSGRPSHLDAVIRIAARRACDAYPIDVSDARAVWRLQSFVWPDQIERIARVRAALEVATQLPIRIDRENFTTWIPRDVSPRDGFVTVLMQTVVEEHLTGAQRDALHTTIASIGAKATPTAPFSYVRMEQENAAFETSVRIWPGGESTPICRSDGHAQDIRWL